MANAAEQVLVRVWTELLNVSSVAPQDNFFELGGDSLVALEMATIVETELGVTFPIDELFVDGSFSGLLAALVTGTSRSDA